MSRPGGGVKSTSSSSLAQPLDRFVRHAVVVLQDAAHPQTRGEHEALGADCAADQIGRLADALGRIDVDEAVAEAPMREHRDGAERQVAVACRHVARARHFGDIELAAAQEAPVPRRRRHVGEHREFDPLRPHDAFLQGAHDLVVAAGERQGNSSRHVGPWSIGVVRAYPVRGSALPVRSRASGNPGPHVPYFVIWVPASAGTNGERYGQFPAIGFRTRIAEPPPGHLPCRPCASSRSGYLLRCFAARRRRWHRSLTTRASGSRSWSTMRPAGRPTSKAGCLPGTSAGISTASRRSWCRTSTAPAA